MGMSLGSLIMICSLCNGAGPEFASMIEKTDGLVAFWRMEGNLHDAKGGFQGKPQGGDVEYVESPAGGKAVSLGPTAWLEFGECPELDLDETTIEFFFKINQMVGEGYNPCLIAKRAASGRTRFSIHVWRDLGQLALWNGKTVTTMVPPDGAFKPGEWYHLAVTNSPKAAFFYLNGVPIGEFEHGGLFSLEVKGLPLQIGAITPEGKEKSDIAVDEAAIYNRVLSADEIASHVDAAGWAERRKQTIDRMAQLKEEQRRHTEELIKANAVRTAERLKDPALFVRGETKVYEGAYLDAISLPVGGIGSGLIQFDGRGRMAAWQIFNNYEMSQVPNSFLAIAATARGGQPVVRALQTVPVGPFPAMKALRFRGEYPLASYEFVDPELPVQVTMCAFNPLIPMNERDSAIPCAIMDIEVKNTSKETVKVAALAAQQNAVGFSGKGEIADRKFESYGGNVNKVITERDRTTLHMSSQLDKAAPGYGDMALTATAKAEGVAAWDSLDSLLKQLAGGQFSSPSEADPSPTGETVDGALVVPLELKAGETKSFQFILAWYFPNAENGAKDPGWFHTGNMYSNWWPNALSVADEVVRRYHDLANQTLAYHRTLHKSNLPQWLLDRVSSQVAVLRSRTCFWAADGYFGGWEGCNPASGCCHGNCAHVWHYAQAHARLFPNLARRMREQQYAAQQPDGALPFRQPAGIVACDAQCGEVLEAYREYTTSPDRDWLNARWPNIRNAMNFAIAKWDPNEDGVLAGPQHNTLDCEIGGSSSWLGSMYLAALKATERMAKLEGNVDEAARFRRIREAGEKTQNETLFNGEYYIQIPDPVPQRDYVDGCHIDQVLGQWWAGQMDLGWIYPQDRVRSALSGLVKYNFRNDFKGVPQMPRKFVDDPDPGTQMIQWPKANRPSNHTLYADEVMSGFEYSAAAAMIQAGMLNEGLMMAKAVWERYDGRLRMGLTPNDFTSWGFGGNPFGDDECGKFYARAMSSWSLLTACQGFIYSGPEGRIGFRPVFQPEDHTSFFTTAEGYGVFSQKREAKRQTDVLTFEYGNCTILELCFELPKDAGDASVELKYVNGPVPFDSKTENGLLKVTLKEPVTRRQGESIAVIASWK